MWWESILLFPGMVLHELSHLLACLLTGTRVTKVKLWGLKEAYVRHEEPGPLSMIIIAFFPFVVNSIMGFVFSYSGLLSMSRSLGLSLFLIWLGLSFSYHAIPSLDDVNNAYQVLVKKWVSAMLGKRGLLTAVFAWLLFIPIFVPLIALVGVMYILSQVEYLGLIWFVIILFLAIRTAGL